MNNVHYCKGGSAIYKSCFDCCNKPLPYPVEEVKVEQEEDEDSHRVKRSRFQELAERIEKRAITILRQDNNVGNGISKYAMTKDESMIYAIIEYLSSL